MGCGKKGVVCGTRRRDREDRKVGATAQVGATVDPRAEFADVLRSLGAGVDPTVVSPGAISITATPIAYSCRDRIGHTDSRVPKSAGSAQRSRGVSASLANAAAPVVSYPKGTSKKYSC